MSGTALSHLARGLGITCDLGDIAWLIETHPRLWDLLTDELQQQIEHPKLGGMAAVRHFPL